MIGVEHIKMIHERRMKVIEQNFLKDSLDSLFRSEYDDEGL